jgi:hypothetical protein
VGGIPRAAARALVLACLVVGGCAGFGRDPAAEAVEVLEQFPPREQWQHLGVVTAWVYGFSYETSLMDRLKEAAAERGANAVVLQGEPRELRDARGHVTQEVAAWAIRLRREGE